MLRAGGLATFRGRMDAEETLCRLERAQGREARCPKDACAFWEPGGAALDGRCVLHGIDFQGEPGLAAWLLEFRNAVAQGAKQ